MNKEQFLKALEERLYGLPQRDVYESLDFYREMIDDHIEDGMTEEEAVSAMGTVDEVTEHILTDMPITKLVSASVKPRRRLSVLEIILLVLGSPIWLTFMLIGVVLFLSVFVVIWSVVIVLFAAVLSLAVTAIAAIAAGVLNGITTGVVHMVFLIGAGFVCVGLAILGFFVAKLVAKGVVWLSKSFVRWVKSLFIRRGNTNE